MKYVIVPAKKLKVLAPEKTRVEKPLDSSLVSACHYTKHSQELIEYVIGTCPKDFNAKDKSLPLPPFTKKKQVTFKEPCETSTHNTPTHPEQQKMKKTNELVIPSTRVKGATSASRSKPKNNTKKDRTLPAKGAMKKVEYHTRNNKSSVKQVWQPTKNFFATVGHQWKPTGRKFTLGEQCPLTRFTISKLVPVIKPDNISSSSIVITERLSNTSQKPLTRNFVKKFIRIVRFGNDHFGPIMGYGDYVIGDSVISRVYYVEGLRHNLFSTGQFYDSDLKVAFRKHSCYVRDVNGVDLIKGNHGTNLYTISIEDMMKSSPICLLYKASKNKSCLWHRRLNHLNFSTINDLGRKDLVRGLPRLKFEKDHLCLACQLGKSQKYPFKPKNENTNLEVLNTLYMDLCGPMRVDTMADQRTMVELLRAPTEGYAEAIVVPLILAEQFELKHSLINMMTSNQFFGLEKDNPHDHIRAARRWLEKEPHRSILTWEDLVSKFINEFFPPSRTTNLRNEISNFQERFDESFHEAWDRYKDLLRACPHHGFSELDQLDTFYNDLNLADQDSLNATAVGNLLERRTQYVFTIIENKSKIAKLTHAVNQQTSDVTTAMTAILKQFQATLPPASVKAVEEIYVTCSGAHPYYQWSGSLPSNTVANPKGKLKAITTQSGLVLDGPSVPTPPPFVNPGEDERVDETLTDQDLSKDPLHLNIPYPSRMLKQKQQEKDEVQIHKFWQMFKQLHINITLDDALILMPKYQKMLKALLSNKEKLQKLANTPLNENCSAVILKKLPEKLENPGKFLIPCGFSELKCKALADLGLPELISSRMTLELANRAICTPAGIARDVFVSVGKFTFPANFVIVDYESDPRVPLILRRPFLQTAHALIDVHGEEMILRDGDERLTLNMRHDTSSYSNQPKKESINLINIFNNSKVKDDIFDPEGGNVLPEKLFDLDSTKDLHPPLHVNPLSGSTTYSSSPNQFPEEFTDELALITFPSEHDDDLQFDIESDLKEIEYLLYHDPIKDIDSSLKDSIDQSNLADLYNNFVDSMPEMFTNEHALDYSSPPIFDEYDDDLFEVESDIKKVYDDPFDSKGEKIKESKLLIDELDLPCDFLPHSEYNSFLSQDFSRVDALPSTNNEDKVFNPGILIQENLFEIITRVIQDKKLAISYASLVIEDSKKFPELCHQGYKLFKINQIFKSPVKIFLFSSGKDTHILAVPYLHFYPLDKFKYGELGQVK
uniref:Integrase, catalytic region, zinc finger, CCHC-type, peptidase aspartic, catalytic n=1 Tax=Tanacetum cinerariifolium TaxID=118510 RepID=A0A6L2KGU8_TANCI|nr:integrase, catalytic region, zinc finger, CCHC-type, peptidase aspartic, catalytic [Tanacetum cinerariifolium]